MNIIEKEIDLFEYMEGNETAWMAHCISADFALGKGIAKQFDDKYNMKNYLIKNYEKDMWYGDGFSIVYKSHRVFNLITKRRYYDKPTYTTLIQSLSEIRAYIIKNNITELVIPRIGCGLDKLKWESVRDLIHDVFDGVDLDIVVCYCEVNNE